jgi:hypothetical protein
MSAVFTPHSVQALVGDYHKLLAVGAQHPIESLTPTN